jgi:uncharacterized protein
MVQFTLEPPSQANLIRSYSATELRIGAQRITRSCVVSATQLITEWPPATFADLQPEHLPVIFALEPELVLLATGTVQRFASATLRGAFAQRRVGLEVMELGAACRTYNVLVQEERRVAAALFLT